MSRLKKFVYLPKRQRRLVSIIVAGFGILLLNSLILFLFDKSTALLYMSNVLLHIVLGILFIVPLIIFLVLHILKMPLRQNLKATGLGIFTAISLTVLLGSGIGLITLGATYGSGIVLWSHIISVFTSIAGFVIHVSMKRGVKYQFLQWGESLKQNRGAFLRNPFGLTVVLGLGISALFLLVPLLKGISNTDKYTLENSPLTESQTILAHDGYLDEMDLSRSESCGTSGCHPDVFEQWSESVHKFSSFNNPYYKKSIEYMTARAGNEPTRWCASCHDPQVLFTGNFADDSPVEKNHWTAFEGITCLSCHAIEGLQDVKGNGRYVIAKPDEYPLARSESDLGQDVHFKLVRAKPEPHRNAMLKTVHRTQEFCGTCHKVGMPPEVNNYKWKRGQNQYDGWQNSGASLNTVRSFYLPPAANTCTSCHMPLVPSDDMGSEDGMIRSHRFASANTAIPFINNHPNQLQITQEALQDSIASVDLFQLTVNGNARGPVQTMPILHAGQEVDLDIVVRNRKVGHAFPAGTNDSNELWLELVAKDSNGNEIFISGEVDEEGRVDPEAHFWGVSQVDQAGGEINKRNPQDMRATIYAHTIGPGTANTVHFNFTVPNGKAIHSLDARLRHRKFKWYFNQWTFRGIVDESESAGPEVDTRDWRFSDDKAPDIPITDIAVSNWSQGQVSSSYLPLWMRWNDYAIGHLLEGDTQEALLGFKQVSQIAGDSPEGPINEARVLIREGQLELAEERLAEAERRRPNYLKTAYFRAELFAQNGQYDEALNEWKKVYEEFPADRVMLLRMGRMEYLSGRYEEALTWLDQVLEIDPESISGLYNKSLALGALERDEEFEETQKLYLYHKDNEEEQTMSADFKKNHPVENREAQAIHIHELSATKVEK